MRYSITSQSAMSLRADHTTSSLKIGTLPIGKVASGEEIFEVTLSTEFARAGDRWLHALDIDGKPVGGWIAIVHLGQVYCTLKDNGSIPPIPVDGVKRIIKSVITYETESGAILEKTLYPE